MTVYYTCKRCKDEMEVNVRLGRENDLPETCSTCDAPIPDEAHSEVEQAAIDQAERACEDDS